MAWYNSYRPQRFDEVIGQDLIKEVLQNAIKKDKVKHAYLFSGTRGVGKTTIARIFANELNDIKNSPQAYVDIIEMDAASNTSIDDIRVLKESAKLSPIAGKYKIFIIDEVHMLSKSAMNALLKTLEEPPSHLLFLLATTNPEKLLPTVLSRLTKLNLSSHTPVQVHHQLSIIAQKEGMNIDSNALDLISERANGSQRDAITLLETVFSYGLEQYTLEKVSSILGLLSGGIFEIVKDFVLSVKHQEKINESVKKTITELAIDPNQFLSQGLSYFIKQSFEGNNSSDSFVVSISTILSKQLQLNSIIQAIGLIIAHIIVSDSAQVEIKKKPKILTPDLSTFTLQLKTVKKVSEVAKENIETTQFGSSFDGKRFFDILKSKQSSPPVLKLMSALLFRKDKNKLVITAPSAMYKATLESPKISDFIVTSFFEEWNEKITVIVEFKDSSTSVTTKPVNNTILKEEIKKLTTITKQNKTGKYFYKIYKSKPEGFIGDEVETYSGPVPRPVPTQPSNNKSFEDHAEDMFEFE